MVPDTAIKKECRDDRLWRAVCRKYLARDHGGGFAPFQGEPLVGVVLLKIGPVIVRQKAPHPLTGTLKEIPDKERGSIMHRRGSLASNCALSRVFQEARARAPAGTACPARPAGQACRGQLATPRAGNSQAPAQSQRQGR